MKISNIICLIKEKPYVYKYVNKYNKNNFPNSYDYYNSALTIPLFYDLTNEDQLYVIDKVKKLIG